MIFADMSPINYFLLPALQVACAATIVALVVGLILVLRRPTRKKGQQTLFVAALSVAVELGLWIVAALLDAR